MTELEMAVHEQIMAYNIERTEYNLFAMLRPLIKNTSDGWEVIYDDGHGYMVVGCGKTLHLAIMDWREMFHK